MPHILGVCGSARSGATEYALKEALNVASQMPDITTEYWSIKGKKITPCIHCDGCIRNQCLYTINDDFQEFEEKFYKADAFIFASPVYDMTLTPQLLPVFSRLRPLYIRLLAKLQN